MKIIFVTQQYFPTIGGIPVSIKMMTHALSNAGHECYIFTPNPNNTGEQLEQEGKVKVVRVKAIPFKKNGPLYITLSLKKSLLTYFKDIDPDIIHLATPYFLSSSARAAARELGIPVVATNHIMPENIVSTLNLPLSLSAFAGRIAYPIIVSFYNACDFVTVPTPTALTFLKSEGLTAPVSVVSNGIDIDRFKRYKRTVGAAEYIGYDPVKPMLLSLGRLDPEKHTDVTIRAFASALKEKDIQLVVAGEGGEKERLRKLVSELGIADNVFFPGYIPDSLVPEVYSAAQIYLISSTAELQSVSTLEALACGTPVIAAQASALKDIIRHGYNGFLYDYPDTRTMAAYILRLINSPSLKKKFSQNSRISVLEHDIEGTSRKLISLYETAITNAHQKVSLRASY